MLSDRAEAADTTYTYAAFISYSRAVDGKLAPALKSALERFAKPWYRLRALRVFRDNDSLTANPGLWPSIQAALDASEYFILLASPKAATSKWVNKETAYWIEHKPHSRLLIAITDGEIAWDHGVNDFDWDKTTALPESLRGKFPEEPRWIDLRWVRNEAHLSPTDGRFLDVIADLAAPLHHRLKDDLVGENVRQHRRTFRIARSAGVALVTLLLVASGAAIIAQEQTEIARQQTEIARRQQRAATSRQLAALAGDFRGSDSRLLALLSIAAWRIDRTTEARNAALSTQHHAFTPALKGHNEAVWDVAFGPDGATIASASSDGTIRLWDTDGSTEFTGARIVALKGHTGAVTDVAFGPDGATLASAGTMARSGSGTRTATSKSQP